MSCIKTFTGLMMDPLTPKAEDIRITDIAHALSMLCRANGHFKSFYSVGQHSINCMHEARARGYTLRVQLACLIHDASEAYISDITRPVKKELPGYALIEGPLQEVIWNKYLGEPLTQEERDKVFAIDDDILYHEFVELMDTRLGETEPPLASAPVFSWMGFGECEKGFLDAFWELLAQT